MAKRQLNKNLVAFLTAAGVVLAVVVVAIAAFNAARRDPAAVAQKAAAQEEAGDLKRAMELYQKAYSIDGEAKYLVEAARVARAMGELAEMFKLLNFAHAQSPRDPQILNALLVSYWEMREYPLAQWKDVLSHSETLLELEPENVLALASKAEALGRLKDQEPGYAAEADDTLQRAAEIDAHSPYVALVTADRYRDRAITEVVEAREAGRPFDVEAALEKARAQRIEALQPALAAYPEDVGLRVVLARALVDSKQWDEGRKLLEQGLAKQPDDPELRYTMAALLRQEAERRREDASQDEIRTLVAAGLEHIEAALEVEAAYYAAYTLRADLQRLGWINDGRWESDPLGCQKAILQSFEAALRDTVGLRSTRAILGRGERLEMIAKAFDMAVGFYRSSLEDAVRSQALAYLRRFLQEGQIQYPEHAIVPLMEGHVAVIDGDTQLAIRAFSEAEKRAGGRGFGRLAREELARLYRRVDELGLSLRYTVDLIQSYEAMQQTPPRWLWLNRAEILIALDKPQEALDLLDSIAGVYAPDAPSRGIRARALALLGRGEEGMQVLQELPAGDPRVLVDQARIAAFNRDYGTAASLLRRVLASNPGSVRTIRLFVQVMVASQRTEEAAQFIREQIENATDERLIRVLKSYEIVLSTTDPDERKGRLLEIIGQIPDEFERAGEYFNFWVAQRDFERARGYLDQMERVGADDQVLQLQFDVALQLEDCARAEQYASRLAQRDADRVGGSRFRGRYEMSCGDPEKALSEFRAAERKLPTDAELKTHIARALLLLKPPRYEEAIQTLERAVEFDPRSFTARSLLYLCYDQTGQREKGIPHLEVAAKLNPDDKFIKERAQLLEEESDPQKGIAWREPLREQNPDDVANLLRLAELYARVGDDVRAEERLQAAIQVEPGSIQVARFGASFYARRANRDAGEQVLRKFLATQEGVGQVVGHILFGRFYELLGNQQAAVAAYQRARKRADDTLAAGSDDHRRAVVLAESELAEYCRRAGRYQEMIDAYRVVLSRLDSDNVASVQAARRNLIRGLLALRQYGDAGKEIADYREVFPKDPRGMMAEAELLLARNQLDEARELLTRVLEAYPDDAWSRYMRGRINVEQQRYTEARDDLLRAKAVAPQGFGLNHRLDLARLYETTGQVELAEEELREMIPLERPNHLVELWLIDLLRNANQIGRAQEFVNELVARDPNQPFWHYQLGRLLMSREEYSAAVRPLRNAVELTKGTNPEFVADWLLALARSHRAAEALQAYDGLDPRVVTPGIKALIAEVYLGQGQRDVAVALLEQGLDAASLEGADALRRVVGRALGLLGNDQGLALLRRLIRQAATPDAELAMRSTLAWYLVNDEDVARCKEGLEVAKAVVSATSPDNPLRIEGLMAQAMGLANMQRDEEAAETYEELIRLAPNDPRALNNLSYMLADKLDRAAEALPYAERVRELMPDNPHVLDTVGWVYLQNGNPARAEATLLEALRLDPGNVPARYHLGQVYVRTGKEPAAERAFRRAVELATEQENEEYRKKAEEALGQLY